MPTSATSRSFKKLRWADQRSPCDQNVGQRGLLYKHKTIREADEIRLLNLRGGKPGDIIKADLETVNVRERRDHDYDAVSYTWADENGDATKCCSLEIGPNGLVLPITRNCESVLRRVQKYTNRVWIDAVCINQDDIQERGKQVDLMPTIYMGASRTFAYVGDASDDSDSVLKNLASGTWTPPHLLASFFGRPYFSRVWVVQEIALSKRITMMCGDAAVKWTDSMDGEHLRRIYTASYYETFPTLFQLDRRHLTRSATVLDALLLGRNCKASDPRDKVFGLMGLVSAKDRLPANYSMSTAEVYTQVAIYLQKVQRLGMDVILGNLCHRSDKARTQTQNLPTWVPDWNQPGPTFLQRVPQALGFLTVQDPFSDKTGLFLRGRILGTVKALRENNSIIKMVIHLSNSRSRASRELPSTYSDKDVYAFSQLFYRYTWNGDKRHDRDFQERNFRNGDFQDEYFQDRELQERDLPNSVLRIIPWRTYAFLVARIGYGEVLTKSEGESQEMLEAFGGIKDGPRLLATTTDSPRASWKSATGLVDRRNNFELLGLVELVSLQSLTEIMSLDSLAARTHPRKEETEYDGSLRTIRIV